MIHGSRNPINTVLPDGFLSIFYVTVQYSGDTSVRPVGRETKHTIIFIPTGILNMKEAMDEAIEKIPGAIALSNVTVKQGGWWIPFIYGQQYFEVEGNPVFESSN